MKDTHSWGILIGVLAVAAGIYWAASANQQAGYVVHAPGYPASNLGMHPTTTPPQVPVPGSAPKTLAPKITSLAPASGPIGSTVTIKGSGFDAKANAILFGPSGGRHHIDGTPDNQIASVGSPDGKTLTFTVPTAGPSGQLCDQYKHCIAVSAIRVLFGPYDVSVMNKNGTSNKAVFTAAAQ
jgi:hypothetical protein